MKIKRFPLGVLWTNCYVVWDAGGRSVVIDPGGDPKDLLQFMDVQGLTLDRILLTHGHYDHIGGVTPLRERAINGVGIHKGDAACLTDPQHNLSFHFNEALRCEPADFIINDGEKIQVGDMHLSVIHTPGHTKGGCCFYFTDGEETLLVSGDTLFARSIGRTDFDGGSEEELLNSLKKLGTLPDNTDVYPGHGPQTTIGEEKNNNPFWPA